MFTTSIQAETADEMRTKVLTLAASYGAKFTADAPAGSADKVTSAETAAAEPPAAEKRGRGRPPKNEAAAAAQASQPAPAADAGADLLGLTAEPTPPAKPALTIEDARNALTAVIQKKGGPAAKELAAKFGFAKLPDLKPEKFGEFIDACNKAVA